MIPRKAGSIPHTQGGGAMEVYVLDDKRRKILRQLYEAERLIELDRKRNLLRRIAECDEDD